MAIFRTLSSNHIIKIYVTVFCFIDSAPCVRHMEFLLLYRASSKYITELRSYYITSQYAPKYVVGKYDRELPDF